MTNQASHLSRRERLERLYGIDESHIRVSVGVVKDGGFTSYIGKRKVVNHAACFESSIF